MKSGRRPLLGSRRHFMFGLGATITGALALSPCQAPPSSTTATIPATPVAGNPQVTGQGTAELAVPWKYLAACQPVLYDAIKPQEYATVCQEAQTAYIGSGIADPSVGLYSATNGSSGVLITNDFNAGVVDIVVGRRPFSDLDQLIRTWRSAGGDKIRGEFEQAWTAANK